MTTAEMYELVAWLKDTGHHTLIAWAEAHGYVGNDDSWVDKNNNPVSLRDEAWCAMQSEQGDLLKETP
jgi:hypothetical protein